MHLESFYQLMRNIPEFLFPRPNCRIFPSYHAFNVIHTYAYYSCTPIVSLGYRWEAKLIIAKLSPSAILLAVLLSSYLSIAERLSSSAYTYKLFLKQTLWLCGVKISIEEWTSPRLPISGTWLQPILYTYILRYTSRTCVKLYVVRMYKICVHLWSHEKKQFDEAIK